MRVENAVAKLLGGVEPALEVEVEVVAAGAAGQEERGDGEEGRERDQDVVAAHADRGSREGLYGAQGNVRERREGEADAVAGTDCAAGVDDAHDAGASGTLVVDISRTPQVLLEAGAELIDLGAGGAEAGDLDDGLGTEVEEGAGGECEEVNAGGEDVFAEVAGMEGKAPGGELGEEF